MIPWVLSDTNYVRGPHQRLDTSWTVFVGGLHGMLNAGMSISVLMKFEILSEKGVHVKGWGYAVHMITVLDFNYTGQLVQVLTWVSFT